MNRKYLILLLAITLKLFAQTPEEVMSSTTISNVAGLFLLNDKLIFSGSGGLWVTDGTDIGTTNLTNSSSGFIFGVDGKGFGKVFKGRFYFAATSGADGKQLWVSDGTQAGTQLFKKFTPSNYIGANLRYFIEYNGKLYFLLDDKVTGLELWSTDGTNSGTTLVKDINPTGNGFDILSSNLPADPSFTIMNNKLYFKATDGVHGLELWVTDGTSAGTQMIKDIYTATNSSGFLGGGSARVGNFCVYNNKLYFAAFEGGSGYYVWMSDGTEAGTKEFLSRDVQNFSLANNFTVFNNRLYFYGSTSVQVTPNNWQIQAGLWSTDGTVPGTTFLRGFNSIDGDNGLSDETNVSAMRIFNNKLYFAAADVKDSQLHLYASDGTVTGTNLLMKINSNGTSFHSQTVTSPTFVSCVFNNRLYFIADDGKGDDLYSTDGTSAGTKKINSPVHTFTQQLTNTQELKVLNGSLYFSANYTSKADLWKIKGTVSAINEKDINIPTAISLEQNYPNPFNPSTVISYKLQAASHVTLKVYDVLGNEAATLVNEFQQAGSYNSQFSIQHSPLSSGVYFYTLKANGFSLTKKMQLIK